MSRRYITVEEQRLIIKRAKERCEYCQCPMAYSTQPFVCEHILPVSRGGGTDLANLALACGGCNGHKHAKVEVLDPVDQEVVLLYNPRQQQWQDHFAWSEDYLRIVGLTPTGRATVEALKMNRPGVINIRRLLRIAGEHPPQQDDAPNR